MDQPARHPKGSVPPHDHEFQDPHFHDADDVEPPPEDENNPNPQAAKRKPARRMPPPRRRYEE
jgi:hypothetical protein